MRDGEGEKGGAAGILIIKWRGILPCRGPDGSETRLLKFLAPRASHHESEQLTYLNSEVGPSNVLYVRHRQDRHALRNGIPPDSTPVYCVQHAKAKRPTTHNPSWTT